ncbi:hypothetical protein [Streptomyces sp. CA-111067]|uniref:hypothetical protein n=1 Tax=Streptomyces sp. CA-111067 TaxID=3240046 RepID=UPI003D96158F
MTDTERPAPTPWIRRRTTQAGIVLLLFLIWSLAARQWTDKGCDAIPQSYVLSVTHFGTPGSTQGCETEPGGPAYTDDYDG